MIELFYLTSVRFISLYYLDVVGFSSATYYEMIQFYGHNAETFLCLAKRDKSCKRYEKVYFECFQTNTRDCLQGVFRNKTFTIKMKPLYFFNTIKTQPCSGVYSIWLKDCFQRCRFGVKIEDVWRFLIGHTSTILTHDRIVTETILKFHSGRWVSI